MAFNLRGYLEERGFSRLQQKDVFKAATLWVRRNPGRSLSDFVPLIEAKWPREKPKVRSLLR